MSLACAPHCQPVHSKGVTPHVHPEHLNPPAPKPRPWGVELLGADVRWCRHLLARVQRGRQDRADGLAAGGVRGWLDQDSGLLPGQQSAPQVRAPEGQILGSET